MKTILKEAGKLIINFFNQIIDKEAERVFNFYKYIFVSDLKERG